MYQLLEPSQLPTVLSAEVLKPPQPSILDMTLLYLSKEETHSEIELTIY